MRTALTIVALAAIASSHTPTITPGKGKLGDLPPKIEDAPLPPFLVWTPVPGAAVTLWLP